MSIRCLSFGALLTAALVAQGARAEEVAVDAEFLEFLGSLDSDDESWTEFLAAAELRAVKEPTEKSVPAAVKQPTHAEMDDEKP